MFRNEARIAMIEFFQQNLGSVTKYKSLWDSFKAYIRGIIIAKHTGILRNIRAQLEKTEHKIRELEGRAIVMAQTTYIKEMNTLLQRFSEQTDGEVTFLGRVPRARHYGEGGGGLVER